MTVVYGLTALAAIIGGLRWLLRRGDDVHSDLDEIRGSRRSGAPGAPDQASVPDAPDVGRPGH